MPAEITVEQKQEGEAAEYLVRVSERGKQTQHVVTVQKSYRDRLADPEISTEDLLRKSFEFLLEREPKESILPFFDLRVIGRYFPEYENQIRQAFGGNRGA